MCVILDTNSVNEVLGLNKTPSGDDLFNWITKGGIKIVVGKTILTELNTKLFKTWYNRALTRGNIIHITDEEDAEVDKEYKRLLQQGQCKSNDQHILALAQISGARLLYTHDDDLKSDFKSFINGKVYPTGESNNARRARRRIHQEKNLCARA